MSKVEKNATSPQEAAASEALEEARSETLPPDEALTKSLPLEEALPETLPPEEAHADAHPGDAGDRPAQKITRPRIRWGAVAWGLIVGGIAAATLAITRTAGGRADFALWLTQLGPAGIWLIAVLAAGGILLLLGLLSAIRRLQRR